MVGFCHVGNLLGNPNKGGGCDIKRRLWISWEPAPPPSPALNLTSHPAGGEPTAV